MLCLVSTMPTMPLLPACDTLCTPHGLVAACCRARELKAERICCTLIPSKRLGHLVRRSCAHCAKPGRGVRPPNRLSRCSSISSCSSLLNRRRLGHESCVESMAAESAAMSEATGLSAPPTPAAYIKRGTASAAAACWLLTSGLLLLLLGGCSAALRHPKLRLIDTKQHPHVARCCAEGC
jgi:hypothetical protein